MGAAVDCESIGPGLLSQPVNASTSLVLVLAGLLLVRRMSHPWVGAALAATGIGSFLFHGPLAPGGMWVHDVTLAWLILVIAAQPWDWGRRAPILGLASLGVLFAFIPDIADGTTVAIFVAALISLIVDDRTRATLLPVVLLAVAAIIGRLGATGGPMCDPEAWVQPHGLWHIGAAVAVSWWALAYDRRARSDASVSTSHLH